MDEQSKRLALKKLLNNDQLLLCDVERERILLNKRLVTLGILRQADIDFMDQPEIEHEARRQAFQRNNFGIGDWHDSLTRKQKWGLYLAIAVIFVIVRCYEP